MSTNRLVLCAMAAIAAIAVPVEAPAADLDSPPAMSPYDWSGFHIWGARRVCRGGRRSRGQPFRRAGR